MRYALSGYDRQTGEKKRREVEADTEADAVRAAEMVVESCQKLPPEPPPQPSNHDAAGPDRPGNYGSGYFVSGSIMLVLGLLGLGGAMADSYHRDRFDSSNAIGAAANALERIEDMQGADGALMGLAFFVGGCLLFVCGEVRRVRAQIKIAKNT